MKIHDVNCHPPLTALRKIALLIAAISSLSCVATRPMLDAYVDPEMHQGATFDYAEVITKDQFSGSPFPDRGLYAWPIGITYDRVSFERLQWGVGLVGLYEKLAIKPPDEYDRLSADNVAITQFTAGGLSQWAGHNGESIVTGGVLVGLPFAEHISITTGIAGKLTYLTNEGDSLWYRVHRRSLYLPFSLILRSVHHRLAAGIELQMTCKERYSMSGVHGDGAMPSKNRNNSLLRISYSFQK